MAPPYAYGPTNGKASKFWKWFKIILQIPFQLSQLFTLIQNDFFFFFLEDFELNQDFEFYFQVGILMHVSNCFK